MESLYEKLLRHGKEGAYPLHMPGHKRKAPWSFEDPYGWDITEIEGYDDLHHPQGILKEAMEQGAEIYGAAHSYFLVNGSSSGLQAALQAVLKPGEGLLMARNCHKSVYYGALQGQLSVTYLAPEVLSRWGICGGISPETVDNLLEKDPSLKAVVITSPTYEGVVSDVKTVAEVTHRHGAVLIVDEAHGAHFSFGGGFPVSALEQGADLVIQSLHKTLPSLTQTALLHVGKGCSVSGKRLQTCLSMYQSSSPSYVLMASVDRCIRYMAAEGRARLAEFYLLLEKLRQRLSGLKGLRLFLPEAGEVFACDPSKLLLICPGKGEWLAGELRKRSFEPEKEDGDSVLLMTTLLDEEAALERLVRALEELDSQLPDRKEEVSESVPAGALWGEQVFSLREAFDLPGELVSLWKSEGRISGAFVYLYPPGIPVLAPGERIGREALSYLKEQKNKGAQIKGLEDPGQELLSVLREEGL